MYGKSFELLRIRGVSYRVDPGWAVFLVLIAWSLARRYFPWGYTGHALATYWSMGAAGAIGLFFCLVLREAVFVAVCRNEAIRIRSVTLFLFGGVKELDDPRPRDPHTETLMALAGPSLNILVALACYGVVTLGRGRLPEAPLAVLTFWTTLNVALAAFQLLPAYPLDGGRVLRACLLRAGRDSATARRWALAIGSAGGLAVAFFGCLTIVKGSFVAGLWWLLAGLLLRDAVALAHHQEERATLPVGESRRAA